MILISFWEKQVPTLFWFVDPEACGVADEELALRGKGDLFIFLLINGVYVP